LLLGVTYNLYLLKTCPHQFSSIRMPTRAKPFVN
jgi:hypothetical protein